MLCPCGAYGVRVRRATPGRRLAEIRALLCCKMRPEVFRALVAMIVTK